MFDIPSPYVLLAKLVAVLALCAGLVWFGHHWGALGVQADWDAEKLAAKEAAAKEQTRQAEVRERVVYQYIDRYHVVEASARVITKEIPKYVTVEADARCIVPRGFVWVWNEPLDLQARPDHSADGPADAPSGVALSAVADVSVEAKRRFESNRGQCEALIDYVKGLSARH